MNKNNTKQSILRQADRDAGIIADRIQFVQIVPVNLIQQAFPDANISLWCFGCEIDVTLPLKFSLMDDVREFCKSQFPEWILSNESEYISDGGVANRKISYRVNGFDPKYCTYGYVEFSFSSQRIGSTCVINKIGDETKVIPVYEVVCSQAAADEF